MPAEVVFMFDIAGVLTTSPYPAARRLAEHVMRNVFERAGAHLMTVSKDSNPALLAQKYSNFYYVVNGFTEKVMERKSSFEQLELGEINRSQFIPLYNAEVDFMLTVLSKKRPQEISALGVANVSELNRIKRRLPLLADPIIQVLIRDLIDARPFLCTIEKVSPRKNVLNLLHYLRVRSKQEIRLVVVTNSWEVEGQYQQMVRSISTTVGDDNWSFFPVSCPIEYKRDGVRASFDINGLFDGYFQSYILHKRKPFPDIFSHAVDETLNGMSAVSKIANHGIKPNLFLFDDVLRNCDTARNLHNNPFTEVFHIDNGAYDVYEDVLKALDSVGRRDKFWADVAAGVRQDIGPLFSQSKDEHGNPTSWINEEINNTNNNLLIVPPPPNENVVHMDISKEQSFYLDEEDRDRILYYCARNIPQYFPIDIPDTYESGLKLSTKKGFATSAGPIEIVYYSTPSYHLTYRVTLRTGSYVIRMQPRRPSPYGSQDIRMEYDLMSHLRYSCGVLVPRCLTYCDSYAVCGRRFFIMVYVDGEVISNITKLIQPRIRRPYSQRRKILNVELQPRKFFNEVINALVKIHNAPLMPELQRQADSLRTRKVVIHPLLHLVKAWNGNYKQAKETTIPAGSKHSPLQIQSLEQLAQELSDRFEATRLGTSIPFPDKLVLTHGGFTLANLVFTHRSLEGRSKYPPQLLSVLDFEYAQLGDPLTDVAMLTLYYYFPPPMGLNGMRQETVDLFPTPYEVMDRYCSVRGYMRHIAQTKRHEIFDVFLAGMCFKRAAGIAANLANVIKRYGGLLEENRREILFMEHLASIGLANLAGKKPSKL